MKRVKKVGLWFEPCLCKIITLTLKFLQFHLKLFTIINNYLIESPIFLILACSVFTLCWLRKKKKKRADCHDNSKAFSCGISLFTPKQSLLFQDQTYNYNTFAAFKRKCKCNLYSGASAEYHVTSAPRPRWWLHLWRKQRQELWCNKCMKHEQLWRTTVNIHVLSLTQRFTLNAKRAHVEEHRDICRWNALAFSDLFSPSSKPQGLSLLVDQEERALMWHIGSERAFTSTSSTDVVAWWWAILISAKLFEYIYQ